jgi:hypothetical protein
MRFPNNIEYPTALAAERRLRDPNSGVLSGFAAIESRTSPRCGAGKSAPCLSARRVLPRGVRGGSLGGLSVIARAGTCSGVGQFVSHSVVWIIRVTLDPLSPESGGRSADFSDARAERAAGRDRERQRAWTQSGCSGGGWAKLLKVSGWSAASGPKRGVGVFSLVREILCQVHTGAARYFSLRRESSLAMH